MSDTQPSTGQFPSGKEIYDGLMAGIEPELTTAQIPLLQQTYAGESAPDRTARMQRYQAAYAAYDTAYAAWILDVTTLVDHLRRDALRSAEASDRSVEAANLSQLETSFAS